MQISLNENERIDDLQINNLKIIQNKNGFCFGMDSVLLSDFAKDIKKDEKVIDLGTGTGILPILLSTKTKAKKIIGIEIQKEVAKMAQKSVILNNLQDKIEIIQNDIKNLSTIYEVGYFNSVITNPPYKKQDSGKINENALKLISRHETTATLEDFIKTANYLLKDKGSFYMVHRPERLSEIFNLLQKYNLKPKKLKMVQPNIKKAPNLIMIKAIKNAKEFLKVETPLYIYDEQGNYTADVLNIYNKTI